MDTDFSAPDDANNSRQLYMYKIKSTDQVRKDFSINELQKDVTKFLNIQDGVTGLKSPNGKCDSQKINKSTEKYSNTCTAFSCSCKTICSGGNVVTSEGSAPDDRLKYVALKPVSAMKGSREKRGVTPPTKLTVKWAPDVYDPIPTSVYHTITNNRPQRQSKKNPKNKHKNKNGTKSTHGIKHKDKKQVRKCGGTSAHTGFNLSDHEVVDHCEPPSTTMDFHAGKPAQLCGSSLLKKYGTSLNISSVAEAT